MTITNSQQPDFTDALDRIGSIAIQHGLGNVTAIRHDGGLLVSLDADTLEHFAFSLAGHGYPTPLELGDRQAVLTLDLDGVRTEFVAPVAEVAR